MQYNLRSCPFCGKSIAFVISSQEMHNDICDGDTSEIDDYSGLDSYTVCCSVHLGGCGAASGYKDNIESAVEAWNKRQFR